MKDPVEKSHLTKLKTLNHTNVSMSPKTILTLKFFYQFCDNCKILSFTYNLKEAEMKITYDFCDTLKTYVIFISASFK